MKPMNNAKRISPLTSGLLCLLCVAFLMLTLAGCAAMQKQLDAADPADKGNPTRQTLVVAKQATDSGLAKDAAAPFPYGTTILTALSSLFGVALLVYKGKSDQSGAKLDVLQESTSATSHESAVAQAVGAVSPVLSASAATLPPAVAPART